ncbi:MAG: UDP-N-acetylmuramate dehydrogenase [Candidatus Omnitrophica bacterium]|nr:UDP-N-acetylmuramate dehydrogenase [Candidatus Omnitrophota bacterium]MDD5352789.1 UDP-N-acetylmuramate dehydrogenase [Candidatus Omnitrophota bacterium]MDD5550388.1 UDP-N-acetylmuramate dehydrogenase [Candidatus Omnitrophota bacterium]
MVWLENLKGRVRFKEPLSKYTSFKIGGAASVLFEPKDTEDLINCLRQAKKNKIPYLVIGNGTNLLISDKGFKGIVIKLTSPFFKRISLKNNILTVGAGVGVPQLIKYLTKTKSSGYEFLTGIPGSIGGAAVMNAGVTVDNKRWEMSDIIDKVGVLNKRGQILNLSKRKLKFGYRKSNLKKYIILEVRLKLNRDDKKSIRSRIEYFLSCRNMRQDISKPSAGCIFKNPSVYLSAGALIDRCGLKGRRFGGAMISHKHANFILNFNRATANDVVKLIQLAKRKVRNNFGIGLTEEIKIVF